MRLLALFLVLIFWLTLTMMIRAEVDFRYRRKEQKDHLELYLRALSGLWRFEFEIPTAQLDWEKGPALNLEQAMNSDAGTAKSKTQVRIRYLHVEFFLRFWPRINLVFSQLYRIKNKFYRKIHCTTLEWQLEIGYTDPVNTALAAGAFWSVLGVFVARLYRQITMDTPKPQLTVVPRFQTPGFSCDIHCIFRLRIGHIILAGLDLFRVLRLDKRG